MGGLLQRENGRHDLSVLVPVMQVGIMRVLMDEKAMLMRMAVRFAVPIGRRMRVPMMRVVDMPVLMKERFVHMLVLVFFGKMQIHARGHERGSGLRRTGPGPGGAGRGSRPGAIPRAWPPAPRRGSRLCDTVPRRFRYALVNHRRSSNYHKIAGQRLVLFMPEATVIGRFRGDDGLSLSTYDQGAAQKDD